MMPFFGGLMIILEDFENQEMRGYLDLISMTYIPRTRLSPNGGSRGYTPYRPKFGLEPPENTIISN